MSARYMLLAVVKKELRQTVRDRRMMALLIMAPLIQLVVFGYAVNLDVDDVKTVVVDQDQSDLSRLHLRRLLADHTLTVMARVDDIDEAESLMEDDDAAVIVVVPPDFERDIVRGRSAEVQAIVDGTDPNRAGVATAAVSGYFAEQSEILLRTRYRQRVALTGAPSAPLPSVRAETRILFNPSLETAIYMVPGVAAILLLLITTIVTAMGLARERERGTLEQILVTPVQSWALILGKILPFAGFGLFDFTLALAAGSWVFDMPIRGSIPLLYGATALYLLTTLGMGLLISSLSGSQQQAFMGGFLFMLPAALLSGIMTPIRSMPEWMQPLTLVNPLRHYAELLRAVLLRGAGFGELTDQLVALAVIGLVIFTISITRFQKTIG